MTILQTIGIVISCISGVLAIMGTIIGATKKYRDKKKEQFLTNVIVPIIQPLSDKLDAVEKKVDQNEQDRLRGIILNMASRLRAGDIITNEEYNDCIYCHDKYVSLGGNGQVKEAFALIEAHFHQKQLDEIKDSQENK